MPRARMKARNDVVWRKVDISQVARMYGVSRVTIWRWVKRAKRLNLNGNSFIDTLSSRPKHHPNELKPEIINRILELRRQYKRCAPVIHAYLLLEGINISLSSVERTLRRHMLTRRKKQAKDYTPTPRPLASFPGCLVEIDTIHMVYPDYSRTYIYAVIDLYSRLGYAEYHKVISAKRSYQVILNAQKYFGFGFSTIQTDHGAEFSPALKDLLGRKVTLRHSRVRKPNDNAHVERFNRTIQEECFESRLPDERIVHKQLKEYLEYYNKIRLHLSLNCKTPAEYVAKVLN